MTIWISTSPSLKHLLRGVNRVPSLLLLNPQQSLQDLHLNGYSVMNCEPLHDVKGHLANLLEELPRLLPSGQREKCNDLLRAKLGAKVSGADMRCTVILLYNLLTKENANPWVLQLLHSIIKVSQILYLDEESPKQVLSLYNNAWLHMELCKDLIPTPHSISKRKMYGIYLHALTSHAPQQYEIVCQKSINAENQERLFGQARRTAEATSNRHPENIIFTVLLRLQAKKELGKILHSVNEADSQVSKAAANLSAFKGSKFSKCFVEYRLHSWQAHLERISPFLLEGEGVWWREFNGIYYFMDGDDDPNYHSQGPTLLHFTTSSLDDVVNRHKKSWKQILDQ